MIEMRIKQLFFDRPKVMQAVDRAKRQALSRAGAFIRTRARTSIRKRRRSSAPGQPPSSHTGILRKWILFGYDRSRDSVVVGPMKTNQVFFDGDGRPVRGTVPQILEEGGSIRVLEVQRRDGSWRRADLRSKRRLSGKKTRLRAVTVEARPYMRPALEKERPNLPKAFRNTVRSG